MLLKQVTFSFMSLVCVFGQESLDCQSKETCRDCIQEVKCAWCITPNNNTNSGKLVYCIHESNISKTWCPETLVVSPQSTQSTVEANDFSSDDNPIQLKPQRIKLSLRRGGNITVHFQYKQAENYPVDLYYIMDLSNSMNPHRKTLGRVGVKLAKALKDLTTNVRLGFGSFIDKVELPFTSTVPDKLIRPCLTCGIAPYSFKNHLNLTDNYEEFEKQVIDAEVSGNLDAPEGGLDAIMQAIVCKELIGWRPQARHLLVYSTDAGFHIAGDGKLAGVIEPNDAKCHMMNNMYTDYLIYDYPSVSHINYIAKENNINIIFGIVKAKENYMTLKETYQQLSNMIENSNFGELQANDNNNVVNLVVTNYKKIVQSVTLTTNATDDIDVKLSSKCNTAKPNGCSDVHVGEIIDFSATIQLRKCPANGETRKVIAIKPEALDESLILEIDIVCDCPCSSPSDDTYQSNSAECSGQGDLKCGICECSFGQFGRNCQCNSSSSLSEDATNCRINDQSEICSGLGECKCGKCECNTRPSQYERIYGKFCQCNNYSCKKNEQGSLCSGKGTCDCGDCKCNAGYKGDFCQCPDNESRCKAEGDTINCSGHGKCTCGQCECDPTYSGRYCKECPSCPEQRCEELRPCVQCKKFESGPYHKKKCELKCNQFKIESTENEKNDADKNWCPERPDDTGCIINFYYEYENKELIVHVQKKKICATPVNILAWIFGVIGTILIAGLIMLIIWKIFTTIHDRREYAKFENERKALRWHRNDNPLYKEATTTFANPAYNRASRLPSK